MTIWITDPAEAERMRKLSREAPMFGDVIITLRGGKAPIRGYIVGSTTGTDIGQNIDKGLGAIVTGIHADIRVRVGANVLEFSLSEIETIEAV